MNRFRSIEDVWEFLDTIPMFQKSGAAASNFSLDNIRAFCERLENPQNQFPSIHVAGTNGKGTTCYLLEQIYSAAGYKTGLFTSPHLLRYHERVRVAQQEISDEAILQFFQTAEPVFEEIRLSYFEISTALAFWFFAEQKVDIAIIETGLGGRLDSTNIINPEVSVITSIGLDHQDILGNTLEAIAREKAGIIKKGRPVVIGNIEGEALNEIKIKANAEHNKLFSVSDLTPQWNHGLISLKEGEIDLQTKFHEKVNKWNVAMAWKVAEILNPEFPVEPPVLKKAIENFDGAPGRFERLHPKYEWYFSGSHNVEALSSSIEAVQSMKPLSETVLIFSAMKDKLSDDFIRNLRGFKQTYFVEQEGVRAAKFADIEQRMDVQLLEKNSYKNILKELQTELVIFVGSFYFYPIVKRWTANVS